MKKIILLISLGIALLFMAALPKPKILTTTSLEGVWELEHLLIYEDNQILDTLKNINGYRQVKIYSKGKVMWSRYNPADKNEWFGYGTYLINNGILEEKLEYASNSMMKIVDTIQVFKFKLEFDKNHYKQIMLDKEGQKINAEQYVKIE